MKKLISAVLGVVMLFSVMAAAIPNSAEAFTITIHTNKQFNSKADLYDYIYKVLERMGFKVVNKEQCDTPTPQPKPEQPKPEQPKPTSQPEPKPQPKPDRPTSPHYGGLTVDEQLMLDLVNKERISRGLHPLKVDMELTKVARLKSQDLINKNYFAHQSPTYGSPFDMMRQFGIQFTYAGENLAGAPNTKTAHVNLMNSPGHRANILNKNYTHIGIGIIKGGRYGMMFTQMFIRPNN